VGVVAAAEALVAVGAVAAAEALVAVVLAHVD
jgi:hypothetical protein